MIDLVSLLLAPLQHLSELGLGAAIFSTLSGIVLLGNNVVQLLPFVDLGPNSPPIVESVTLTDAPYGPSRASITVDVTGTRVYVHGSLRDPDGCEQINYPASVQAALFPTQIGSCSANGALCLFVPYSSAAVTVDHCTLGSLTARYQVEFLLYPIPVPAGTTNVILQHPWTAEISARDFRGATASNSEQTTIVHPGNSEIVGPLPSSLPYVPVPESPLPYSTTAPTLPPWPSASPFPFLPASPIVPYSTVAPPSPFPAP